MHVTGVWLAVTVAELFTFMLAIYLDARSHKFYNYL